MTPADTAKRCFEENLQLFAPSRTQPEKYNLYHGLALLAETLSKLESEIRDLSRRIRNLEHK